MQQKAELHNFTVANLVGKPVYVTVRVGGEDHAPQFLSSVQVGEERYEGYVARSRKEAERLAAAYALDTLVRRQEERLRRRLTVLLIEGGEDTLARLLPGLTPTLLSQVDIYLFVPQPLAAQLGFNVEIVPCGSDPMATLFAYLGFFLGCHTYEHYGVASHSSQTAESLAALQSSMLGAMNWPATGVTHVTDGEHFFRTLQSHEEKQ